MPKRIPNKPRYTYAQERAKSILAEYNITTFPVDPFRIIDECKDSIYCLTWSQLAISENEEDPFYLKKDCTDARICWDPKSNKYLLVYDDEQPNPFRLRWTIMHELGHFFLGHLTDFPETALKPSNNDQFRQDYGVLEREAHAFAAEVLCPSAIFQFFRTSGEVTITKEYLAHLFLLSNEASEKRLNCIITGTVPISKAPILFRNFYNFFQYEQPKALYKNLSLFNSDNFPYPHYDNLARKCPACHSYIAHADYCYCPYCGFKLGSNYYDIDPIFEYQKVIDEDIRIYNLPSAPPPIQLCWSHTQGGMHHLLFCPHCFTANSSSTQFCTHCGTSFANMCLSEHRTVPQEARFCPYCGDLTTFHAIYGEVERAATTMNFHCQTIAQKLELEPCPYWDFLKTRTDDTSIRTALAYSQAYINDNDELIIFVRDQTSKTILQKFLDPITLSYRRYAPKLSNVLVQVVH